MSPTQPPKRRITLNKTTSSTEPSVTPAVRVTVKPRDLHYTKQADRKPNKNHKPQPYQQDRRAVRSTHASRSTVDKPVVHDARQAAVLALEQVFKGHSLTHALPQASSGLSAMDQRLAQAICYGVLREYEALEDWLNQLMEKPIKESELGIKLMLLVALYQISAMDVPDYAAVSNAVDYAKHQHKLWATGLINAVLRRALREPRPLPRTAIAQHAMPNWLLKMWQQDWPTQWSRIAQAARQHPPMTLRVQPQAGQTIQTTVAAYQQLLQAQQMDACQHAYAVDALVLTKAVGVERLPQFAQGAVAVQDAGAQLAARLIQPAPQQRILDACAAPGGKTAHLIACCPQAQVVAVDHDATRLVRVNDNLVRMQLQAEVVSADLANADHPWLKQIKADPSLYFDAILLDAPCSATGVIARHPDIKYLRMPSDIAQLVAVQRCILQNLWSILKPNGRLLYVTCSVSKAENEQQIAWFTQQVDDVHVLPLDEQWGHACSFGRQILPSIAPDTPSSISDAMDGFYYCLLQKKGS